VKIWGLLKDSTGKNLITTFSMDDNREAWMSPHVSEIGIHQGNASQVKQTLGIREPQI
jgi:hypothetical protein